MYPLHSLIFLHDICLLYILYVIIHYHKQKVNESNGVICTINQPSDRDFFTRLSLCTNQSSPICLICQKSKCRAAILPFSDTYEVQNHAKKLRILSAKLPNFNLIVMIYSLTQYKKSGMIYKNHEKRRNLP